MTRDALVTLAVFGCCVLAIGTAAGAMESAVETTPDDAINVAYRSIPLDGDTVDELKDQLQGGSETTRAPQAADGVGGHDSPQTGPDGSALGDAGGNEPAGLGGGAGIDSPPQEGWLDRLMALLRALLAAGLALGAVLIGVATVVLGLRHRERLIAGLRSLWPDGPSDPDGPPGRPATNGRGPPPADPANEVAGAWYEMVRGLGLADRETVTPRDCVAAAEAAGIDPGPVDRLTAVFERVRYGDAPVTDARRERSRAALEEIRQQLPEARGR